MGLGTGGRSLGLGRRNHEGRLRYSNVTAEGEMASAPTRENVCL